VRRFTQIVGESSDVIIAGKLMAWHGRSTFNFFIVVVVCQRAASQGGVTLTVKNRNRIERLTIESIGYLLAIL
jgi:hypothetical protein